MEAFSDQAMLIAYISMAAAAICMAWCSWKWPPVGRILYFLLFASACWVNLNAGMHQPELYLEYARFTLIPLYKTFIAGFFSHHITLLVSIIAICQGLIAVSMLLKRAIFRTGALGGIFFLISIAPLGVGAAFPCTLIMAAGLRFLLDKSNDKYIWQAFYMPVKKVYPANERIKIA